MLVTGAAGLVGSAAVRHFAARGWRVSGLDNDQRRRFFGPEASTAGTRAALQAELPGYTHHALDLRDAAGLEALFAGQAEPFELVVHAAAQPSHDWAATAPLEDFDINARGTLGLLELCRRRCPEAVFVFVSTNKVYGDTPNHLPLVERATRLELDPSHAWAARGIDESMRVDQCLHSLFGCSKLAADAYVQEYGRYFGLKTGCFRCGCITGAAHAGAEQHGFLAYLMRCAVGGAGYTIYGHQGKQVRDNIHAADLAAAFECFQAAPRPGEVYNLGGGRERSCSVREAIARCEALTGRPMSLREDPRPRKGDHRWWVSDVSKFERHYPAWRQRHDLDAIFAELHAGAQARHAQPSR